MPATDPASTPATARASRMPSNNPLITVPITGHARWARPAWRQMAPGICTATELAPVTIVPTSNIAKLCELALTSRPSALSTNKPTIRPAPLQPVAQWHPSNSNPGISQLRGRDHRTGAAHLDTERLCQRFQQGLRVIVARHRQPGGGGHQQHRAAWQGRVGAGLGMHGNCLVKGMCAVWAAGRHLSNALFSPQPSSCEIACRPCANWIGRGRGRRSGFTAAARRRNTAIGITTRSPRSKRPSARVCSNVAPPGAAHHRDEVFLHNARQTLRAAERLHEEMAQALGTVAGGSHWRRSPRSPPCSCRGDCISSAARHARVDVHLCTAMREALLHDLGEGGAGCRSGRRGSTGRGAGAAPAAGMKRRWP